MAKLIKAQHRLQIVMERYRCGKCDTRFEQEMVVNIVMEVYTAQMKSVRCPNCGTGAKGILMGEGRRLDEDRGDRAEAGLEGATIERRFSWWKDHGDSGNSSRSIAHHMMRLSPHRGEWSVPQDLADFRRCLLLLDLIPEWRALMPAMAGLNAEWKRIAPIWDGITDAYVRDCPNYAGASQEAYRLLTGRDD